MPMPLQLLVATGLLFTTAFASAPALDCTGSGSTDPTVRQWIKGCCTNPSGSGTLQDPSGACATKAKPFSTADPRVFGPALWKAFHMIAANFPSPPTKAAHQACVAFITALPYLVPCRHCGWDLGDFIKRNIDNDGQTDPGCFGFDGQGFSQSVCESPERACMSTYRMTSFFARAHNNVNSHTNPCRKPYTTEEALDQYLYAPDGTCHHNTVWGSDPVPDLANQLCTGPYCDKTPITGSCYQPGSLLPVGGDGTGCIGDCPDLGTPEAGHADYRYYGTNATAGCDTNTAVACGNVQCHAPSTVKSTFSGKDEQGKHDFFTLRKFFDEKEISFEFSRPHFVGVALEMLKDKSSSELEQLEHKDPAVFEVMERRGSPRARTTGTSSGASSLRSSGSTSGSSGGSGACGSGSS
eukprot:scaffold112426_cov63-Phaeocystis_antarctica.AAC.4